LGLILFRRLLSIIEGRVGQVMYSFVSSENQQGTQYLLTNWKNNPNERKNARSNRRG
jgi:hypothetical protein